MFRHDPAPAQWFSANADRAWAERFFLAYSPIWMIAIALVMATGLHERIGEVGFLAVGFLPVVPLIAVPAWRCRTPWRRAYWLKANLYLGIFAWFGSYFGSEYF